jgi:NTP pyrophosphatase (non-canonical NTP hydrolase)
MKLNDLQNESKKTWSLPKGSKFTDEDVEMLYIATCLGGETGELLNKIKKSFRLKYYTKGHAEDNVDEHIKEEVADVLYYISRLAELLNIDMEKEFAKKMEENVKRYGMQK